MTREEYLRLLRDLLSDDAVRVREANRRLYAEVVAGGHPLLSEQQREADLVLAEVPGVC